MIRGAQGLVESTPAEALLGSRHHHLYPCHQLASFPKQIAAVGQETDHCGGGGGCLSRLILALLISCPLGRCASCLGLERAVGVRYKQSPWELLGSLACGRVTGSLGQWVKPLAPASVHCGV